MPSKELDATDIRILKELQVDGRISNAELAKRINLSPSPCLSRVRNLEREKVIDRYVALLTPSSVGLSLSVFIRVSLDRQIEKESGTLRSQNDRVSEYR